jgi:predicted transcriptional regulator
MKTSTHYKAGAILLFLFIASSLAAIASADNGGYIVTPATDDTPVYPFVDQGETTKNITFWNLPLWVQISVIGGTLTTGTVLFKYTPLLLGKVFVKMDNPTLQTVISYIKENPGCIESEITRDLDIKRGTLRYYLERLNSQKHIFTIKSGRVRTIFHIACMDSSGPNRFHVHFKNDAKKAMLRAIMEEPGITGTDLSSKLGVSKSTIHWHLYDLKNDDMVHIKKDGKFNRYYPKSSLEEPAGCKEFLIVE